MTVATVRASVRIPVPEPVAVFAWEPAKVLLSMTITLLAIVGVIVRGRALPIAVVAVQANVL